MIDEKMTGRATEGMQSLECAPPPGTGEGLSEAPVQIGANYDPIQDAVARTRESWVELPGFGDSKPWRAKLRRLSLLDMAMKGQIPNPLLSAVQELYAKGTVSNDLAQSAKTMRLMAEAALVEPTLSQLDEAGVLLTDMQYTAIFLYSQRGPDALRFFRQAAGVSEPVSGGEPVRQQAQRAAVRR